jgi:hypothetical protein
MNENIVHFWQSLATVSLGIIVTLLGFWATIAKKIVSREEICEMIKKDSVYVHDRQFIMERLSAQKENHKILTDMLQRNTDVMNELKIQIATLGKTLEALEERIERS